MTARVHMRAPRAVTRDVTRTGTTADDQIGRLAAGLGSEHIGNARAQYSMILELEEARVWG